MKKKILVPIMALAIAVTAGVNYKMISEFPSADNMSLKALMNMSVAQAEWVYSNGEWMWDAGDLEELEVRPSERSRPCIRIDVTDPQYSPTAPYVMPKFNYGTVVTCTEKNGDGCEPHECDAKGFFS